MKFETPAGINPIDQLKVIGQPTDRIEGPLKTTGTAKYAYEHNDAVSNPAYGYVVGAAIAKGRIKSIDQTKAKAAPGVLAIVTAASAGSRVNGSKDVAVALRFSASIGMFSSAKWSAMNRASNRPRSSVRAKRT